MTPETFKLIWRCLLAYSFAVSVALFTIGLILGLSLNSSRARDHHNYPVQVEPDHSTVNPNRGT